MTEQAPEPGLDDAVVLDSDDFVGEPPAGDANPGDYLSNDQQGGTSPETGTTYDAMGEPESTPHDAVITAEDEEEL
jgi:hypothetical protein